jgi:hypothetical protein
MTLFLHSVPQRHLLIDCKLVAIVMREMKKEKDDESSYKQGQLANSRLPTLGHLANIAQVLSNDSRTCCVFFVTNLALTLSRVNYLFI